MHIADMLTRAHLPNTNGGEVFDNVNMVSCLPIRKEGLDKICRATKDDQVMCTLIETILSGWLSTCILLPNKEQILSARQTDIQG